VTDKSLQNPTNSIISFILAMFLVVPVFGQSSFMEGGFQSSVGQDGGLYYDSPARRKIDLSGPWQVSVDGAPPNTIQVPSAYDGVAELVYERTFQVDNELLDGSGFFIVAYGVNHSAEIHINGISVGSHSGGYSSFRFSVPHDILRSGENTVRVSVHNSLHVRDTLPIRAQLWTPRNYAGIFRDIYILATPDFAITDQHIRTTFLDGLSVAEIDIDLVISRQDASIGAVLAEQEIPDTNVYAVMVELFERSRGQLLAQSQRQNVEFENARVVERTLRVIARNPRLWSPDQPELYTVSMVLFRNGEEFDRKNIIYGFRDIAIRDGRMYLNGELFRARGVLYHEYHPRSGSSLSYEDLERDVALMKIANINLVRVAFHPPHPYLLNLFDRYGMLCMIEIPAVNIPGTVVKNANFMATARSYLEETIRRDRHHPSVLAWGIGDNIEMPHPGAVEYATAMRTSAQRFDNRPVYAGSQFPVNDLATEHLDLAVLNIPAGLTEGIDQAVSEWKNRYPDKPLIIGKLGYRVEPGNTAGYGDVRSHDAQAHYLLQTMQKLRELDVDGIIVNSFTDWRAERPTMVGYTDDLTLHTTGIMSADRRQRRGFDIIRSLYRGEKAPSLTVGESPGSTPFSYIVGGFIVLIGFAYMVNSSRRFRENVNRSLIRPYNFYADVRDQRILSGFHTVYLGFLISLTMAMIFASFLQHYRTNQVIDYIFTHFLIFDVAKSFLATTVMETWQLILILTALYFLILVATALVIQLCSVFVKTRVYMSHSFVVTFWSALPLVGFIPLSMILYNVLETKMYVVPILILIGILLLWVLFRLLKGISIIYDVLAFRVYSLGIFLLVSVNGIMLLISEYTHATFAYISFFIHMFEGFRF
jgi:hypothetical protein